MDLFGSYALLLAFLCGLYAFFGGIAAIITRKPLLIKSARNAGMAVCVMVWLGFASLAYLFLTDNFSMAYVVEHSNRTLPTFFKIPAIWAGQQGSLLFWSFLLSIYVFSALFAYRHKHPELMPYVGVVLAGVQLFFLTLNNFVSSPFQVLGAPAANGALQWISRGDGQGLNPLLQYPEMVIHPPILYSGYTGFAIPFAFALGALLGRYPGEKWIHLTRRWTMIAWGFQGVGILLGAHWAYAVLGWGGYWAWDPVENASLMPWLTGHRVSSLGHDAGKARHDARLERLAGVHHVPAHHHRHHADAHRHGQFRARLRAIDHRPVVLWFRSAWCWPFAWWPTGKIETTCAATTSSTR